MGDFSSGNIDIGQFQIYLIIDYITASSSADEQGMVETTEEPLDNDTSPAQLFVSTSSITLEATTMASLQYEEGTSEMPVELQTDDENQNESNDSSSASYAEDSE